MRERLIGLSMACGAAGIAANALAQTPGLVWLNLVWPVLLIGQFALLWRGVRVRQAK